MKITVRWCFRRYLAAILLAIPMFLFFLMFVNNSYVRRELKQTEKFERILHDKSKKEVVDVKLQWGESELKQIEIVKKCYELKNSDESVKLLDDIMMSKSKPTIDRTIFFHDTSCKNGTVSFTPRQACAIESAAKWNPNRDIFVLFAAPVGIHSNGGETSPIMKALSSYPNIHYRNVDWYNYAIGTSAEKWIKEDRMLKTEHYKGHLSDFLRILSLYRFGGIHLDMEFVVQKSFDNLPLNFVALESSIVQNSVLGFESKNNGHKIVELILREFTERYSPKAWWINGPTLVTRIVLKICKTINLIHAKPENCSSLNIYNKSAFFPVHSSRWTDFFDTDPKKVEQLQEQVKDAFAIHLYNQVSHFKKTPKSQPTFIRKLVEKNCPKIMEASGDEF